MLIVASLLVWLGVTLSACGFQPVYATKAYRLSDPPSGAVSITGDLAQVRLLPVKETFSGSLNQNAGRGGQKLQNLLIDRMYADGYPQHPNYTLDISLDYNEVQLGLQKDATATRAELQLKADIFLRPVVGAAAAPPIVANASHASRNKLLTIDGRDTTSATATVYHTDIRTRVSYNILDAQYGTLVARENAIDRGLEQVADEVVTRLSLYFSRDPAAAATALQQVSPPQTTLPATLQGPAQTSADASGAGIPAASAGPAAGSPATGEDTLRPAASSSAAKTAPGGDAMGNSE